MSTPPLKVLPFRRARPQPSTPPVETPSRKSPTSKSPIRKSPARRSPARKSPARRSPARKSPARRSPARTVPARKSSPEKAKIIENKGQLSPKRELRVRVDKNIKIDRLGSSDTVDTSSKTKLRPSSSLRTTDVDAAVDSEIAKLTSLRQTPSTHQLTPTPSATATTEFSRQSRSASRSVYEISQKSDEYSDQEDASNDKSSKYSRTHHLNSHGGVKRISEVARKIPIPKQFGTIIGACLYLLFVPVLAIYLQWCCNGSTACDLKQIKFSMPKWNSFEKFFTIDILSGYIAYNSGILILSLLVRLGREVKLPWSDRGLIRYHFNSFAVSLVVSIALIIAEALKYPIIEFILKNYLKLLVFNILNALIMAIFCFIISRHVPSHQLNPSGKSGNVLIDFVVGRDIRPKLFDYVDIKLYMNRISWISTLIIAEILIFKNLQLPSKITPALVAAGGENATWIWKSIEITKFYYKTSSINDLTSFLSACMILIYVLDSIIFEHHLATSFELQHEGVGAHLLLRYAITPFLLSAVPKYLFDYKPIKLPLWYTICMVIIFVTGIILKRTSNSIKYRYRMNPYTKDWSAIATIPTFQNKRLILGKLWGTVRQPNYVGDILALIAIIMPLYGKFALPPLIGVISIIVYLLHRAARVNARNFDYYNAAWTRYANKVPYKIIPKIY